MQLPTAAERIAIVVAMVPEARPIVTRLGLQRVAGGPRHDGEHRGRRIVLTTTSMGTQAAARATEELLEVFEPDHLLIAGICGGVDPADPIGALVLPAQVCDDASGAVLAPHPLGEGVRGCLLTTDVLYRHPDDRARLAARGVRVVDMETAAIGAVCEDAGVVWSVLRAVSDPVGDPRLDEGVLGLSNPDGSGRPGAALAYLARRPHRLPKLVSLGRGMSAAVRTCTDAIEGVLTRGTPLP